MGVVESDRDENEVGFVIRFEVEDKELNVSSLVVDESDERQLFTPDVLGLLIKLKEKLIS